MAAPLAFFDVDTQIDFMDPAGKLYVPHAEDIIPRLVQLMTYARQRKIPVLSSADAHAPDDPEFKIWPPHCVTGTRGQQHIKETSLPGALTIPNAFRRPSFRPKSGRRRSSSKKTFMRRQ